jgi:signal transduction histidine kinase
VVHHEAMRSQVELKIEIDDPLAEVSGQRTRLGQAILGLLLNGVQASPSGGCVRLEARNEPDAVVLVRVSDEGEGMANEAGERSLEPFVSGRAPDRGLGLGLMAANLIALAHGGALTWESTPGRGSSFSLRVPAGDRREETEK